MSPLCRPPSDTNGEFLTVLQLLVCLRLAKYLFNTPLESHTSTWFCSTIWLEVPYLSCQKSIVWTTPLCYQALPSHAWEEEWACERGYPDLARSRKTVWRFFPWFFCMVMQGMSNWTTSCYTNNIITPAAGSSTDHLVRKWQTDTPSAGDSLFPHSTRYVWYVCGNVW